MPSTQQHSRLSSKAMNGRQDCCQHQTCQSCAASSCNWCVKEGVCYNNITSCSATSQVIRRLEHCPINQPIGQSMKPIQEAILIPHGARREIAIDIRNLITSTPQTQSSSSPQLSLSHFLPHPLNTHLVSTNEGFECVVEIEGARERVTAKVKGDKIVCSENRYTYQADVPELTARLEVIREGDTFIDRINFTLYKCNLFASFSPGQEDCSLCQIVDRKYNCVWCSDTCSFIDACVAERPASSCPASSNRIEPLYPLIHGSSPIEVSTLSRVEGGNRENDNDDEGHHQVSSSNHMHSKHKTSSSSNEQLSPLVICLISGAAVGVVLVIVLIAVTTVKRKGSSGSTGSSAGSSSLSSGHHHLFATSDAVIGTKIPSHHHLQHPLISNCKPLPLVPLIDRESSLYDKVNPCQPPTTQPPPLPVTQIKPNQLLQSPSTESAVNVIYSEINDYNEEEEDGRVLISSSTSGHGGPQLIHLHQTRNPSPNMTSTRPVNYPGQFITINTVGRNSQRNGNAYVYHDSIPTARYLHHNPNQVQQKPQTTQAITVAKNNSSSNNGINTYAVYAYDKFTRSQRGRQSNGSSSSSRDRFV